MNRPKYRDVHWSLKQAEVLQLIHDRIGIEDEAEKRDSRRWLYVKGAPGSGKSAVILEVALRCARAGIRVLIVCPTGQLVCSFKAALPDVDGIENIQVDTIAGVLKYQRPGQDGKVKWSPPSALRKNSYYLWVIMA